MLICATVQPGHSGLLVNSTCGAEIPITIYGEVVFKMRVGLHILYSCQGLVGFFFSNCRILAYAVISLGVSDYLFFSSFRKKKKRSIFPEVGKAKILVILK